MYSKGLQNPLGIAKICASLEAQLLEVGYRVQLSTDFKALDSEKFALRGDRVGPMHDCTVCDFSMERAFWVKLIDVSGQIVGLQAYRCDYVDTSLADWLPNYMIGVYMRREELMMPSQTSPPQGSISWRMRGRLVYEGELWLAKAVKARNVFDAFARLGMMLSIVKWNPDAIWGLASQQMARHGHVGRIGYTILERGFLRWQWAPKDVDPVEYLAAIERPAMEQMVEDMLVTE